MLVQSRGAFNWDLHLSRPSHCLLESTLSLVSCPLTALLSELTVEESPRWLIKKNKYRQAFNSLRRLRNTPLQAARDLYYIHAKVTIEKKIILSDRRLGNARFAEKDLINVSNYLRRFIQLFTIPRNRRSTLAAFVVMIAQQMCGSMLPELLFILMSI